MVNSMGANLPPVSSSKGLWKEFNTSLTPEQKKERTEAMQAKRKFNSELSPEQKALKQKWIEEKRSGADKSVWTADRKAFTDSLNPEQNQARKTAFAEGKEFRDTLSPEQKKLRHEAVKNLDLQT